MSATLGNTITHLRSTLDKAQQVDTYAKQKGFAYTESQLKFALSPKCHDYSVYLDDVASGKDKGVRSEYRYYTEQALADEMKLCLQYGCDADDIDDGELCLIQLVRRFGWKLEDVPIDDAIKKYVAHRI
jgi:hypothetical protein